MTNERTVYALSEETSLFLYDIWADLKNEKGGE